MKKLMILMLMMVMALPFYLASIGIAGQAANQNMDPGVKLSANSQQEGIAVHGTVSKIEGNQVTLENEKGEEITLSVVESEVLADLQVGDKVLVKNGKIIKNSKG